MNARLLRPVRDYFCLMLVAIALQPAPLQARTILAAGRATTWKYLDTGVEPEGPWRQVGYDDTQWKSGPAPLGFGEATIATQVFAGLDKTHRPITNWFRCEFDPPELDPGESLVILCCIDDGAIVYLNGEELGRINMPTRPVRADTLARQTIGNDDEGPYRRMHVPAEALRLRAKNVLAVEVHQATTSSSDLYFDLALKVVPALENEAKAQVTARAITDLYNKRHYIGPDVTIPDGYIDGGRGMKVTDAGNATSHREILAVDRSRDKELAADLAFARSPELKALAPLVRVQRLAARIDRQTTPPGGSYWVEATTVQLEREFTNRPVLIGDWLDQAQAGVCRHRALLFKLLADEAGLRVALVRGNFSRHGPPGFPHVWNEVTLDDGQRVLVDLMLNGGKAKFPPLTDAEVIQHYLKVDDTPWYGKAE